MDATTSSDIFKFQNIFIGSMDCVCSPIFFIIISTILLAVKLKFSVLFLYLNINYFQKQFTASSNTHTHDEYKRVKLTWNFKKINE